MGWLAGYLAYLHETGKRAPDAFYACARRGRLFAKVAAPFVDDVAALQADAVGLKLNADELDRILLHGQIAFGAAGWDDVRDAFAGPRISFHRFT